MAEALIPEARIKWLMRRGMRELDVMLNRYFERRYAGASTTERSAFLRLLTEIEDPDIWAWTMAQTEVPPEYRDVVEQLRIHH